MKILPDQPSLDHLRQQAKELLGGLRQTRPDGFSGVLPTLSDAQALLAQEYGYRGWPELKAEVDRRRADVQSADPELTAAVAAAFELGKPTGPMRAQELGWAGQVWALGTDRGAWLATQLFDYTPTGNIEHEFRLVEAAVAAGVPTPEPIRDRNRQPLTEIAGDTWRAHRELSMGPAVMSPISTETAIMIGRIVGTLHRLRLPAPGPVHTWLTCRPNEDLLRKQLERSRAAAAPWADAWEQALPALLALADIVDDRDPAEEAILSHGGPGPGVFFRRNHDELAMAGWDHSCAIPPSWELGSVLENWGTNPTGELNKPSVAGLMTGYREASGTEPYLDLGMFSGKVTGWLNWVESRVNVALDAADPKVRDLAARELPNLLAQPLTRNRLEEILAVAGR